MNKPITHDLAFPQLELARRGEVEGYISTHSLAELYAVMTCLPCPLRVLPDEANAAIAVAVNSPKIKK